MKEIPMKLRMRSWTAGVLAASACMAIPAGFAVVAPAGVANADVCASVGNRISVSGCTNLNDTVNSYVPPPDAYAPLPGDFRGGGVNVCANVGRRVSVSGCI